MDPDPDPFHLVKRTPIITWQIVGLSLSLILFIFCSWVNAGVRPQPKRKPILKKAFFYAKIDRKDGVDISDKGFIPNKFYTKYLSFRPPISGPISTPFITSSVSVHTKKIHPNCYYKKRKKN